MKTTFIGFLTNFYGHKFYRHFRRPPIQKISKFRIQFKVETPKELYLHIHRNSGTHPCLISTYDHGNNTNLKHRQPDGMVFDRAFFDFDIHHEQSHKIKKELQILRKHGLKHKLDHQERLRNQLQDLIIDERIVEPAMEDVKRFSIRFKEFFGREPILFFSGCKGCHAYTFFEPLQKINFNLDLHWFGVKVKQDYNYQTLDLSVLKDAESRLSRIPYTKHEYSGLTVVPFTVDDEYDAIIKKSVNPVVESFRREDYHSSFAEYLEKIDPILKQNEKMGTTHEKAKRIRLGNAKNFKSFSGIRDHRDYFQELLGSPESEHHEKEYVMYCCPFPDHEDNNPSFMVHRTGYKCYGCQRNGNLARKKDFQEFKKNMGEKL